MAEKPEWTGHRLFGVVDYEALPGFGRHDDLWLVAMDERRSQTGLVKLVRFGCP